MVCWTARVGRRCRLVDRILPGLASLGVVLSALALGRAMGAQNERGDYVLGVLPFLPPQRLEKTFAPMAARIGETLGRKVQFRTSSSFLRFQERLSSEEYDFAIVDPFMFVQLDREMYQPLARAPGAARLDFVVAPGSEVETIDDLRGEIVAVEEQGSFASLLAMHRLIQEGIDPYRDVTLQFLESPFSCAQHVLAGAACACAIPVRPLESFELSMKVKMKKIGESVSVPQVVVVVHRRVTETEKESLSQLLTHWQDDPRNHLDVPGAQIPNFVPIDVEDYQSVRDIQRFIREHCPACR